MQRRFYNGGIVFSTVVLMFIAMISLYSFLLLVRTRLVVHGSFGGTFAPVLAVADPGQISAGSCTASTCAG